MDESHLTVGTTSPFLPGTLIQYAWDSTSLGYLKTCPRLYQYQMIDGWSNPGESIHLRFGIEYHTALQAYDIFRAEGLSRDDAIHRVIAELLERTVDFEPDRSMKPGKYKNRDTLMGLVLDYLDHFEEDPAETYIKSDGKPAVELSFRFELDFGPESAQEDEAIIRARGQGNFGEVSHIGQPYLLSGHLDRVVSFNDHLFVMDHKTTTTTPGQYYFHQYEPNNQMTLYTLGGQVVLDSPIKGVIISAAQILLDSPNRFVRGFTYRTADQIEEWLNDLRILLQTNETYAEAEYWPMNDMSCDKYGGCRFREVCSKSPQVRDMFLKTDFIKLAPEDRWNPIKSR